MIYEFHHPITMFSNSLEIIIGNTSRETSFDALKYLRPHAPNEMIEVSKQIFMYKWDTRWTFFNAARFQYHKLQFFFWISINVTKQCIIKKVLGIFHRLVIVLGNSLQTANVCRKMQSQITQWIPDAKQNILLMFYLSTHIHVFTVCNETKKKYLATSKSLTQQWMSRKRK